MLIFLVARPCEAADSSAAASLVVDPAPDPALDCVETGSRSEIVVACLVAIPAASLGASRVQGMAACLEESQLGPAGQSQEACRLVVVGSREGEEAYLSSR